MVRAAALLPLVLGVCISGAVHAAAESLRLVPADALIADGQTVELVLLTDDGRTPTVRATVGAVLALAPTARRFRVRYRTPLLDHPTTDELAVAYGGRVAARLRLPLRAAGRVSLTISVAASPLVLTPHAATEVRISVRDAAGQPAPVALRLGASIGQLSTPTSKSIGEYVARYTPPGDHFPQVAILVAVSVTDGAFAAAPLPLAAPVRVDGRGEPNATMTITVNQRTFGPVTIDADGRFALPIVVPPGGHALGRSVDVAGNAVEREIDLHLPPFPRVLLSAVPAELPVDGRARAEIVAFSVDPRGKPAVMTRAALRTDAGTLGPARVDPSGATVWTLTAPSERSRDHATLAMGDAHVDVALGAAPPFRLDIAPSTTLIAGRTTLGAASVTVLDAAGAPVSGATLTAQLPGGRVLGIAESTPGHYTVDVTAPEDAGSGHAKLTVALERLRAGAPRRLTLHATPRAPSAVEAWVDDDLGLPVSGALVRLSVDRGAVTRIATDRFGTAQLVPSPRPAVVLAELDELPGAPARLEWTEAGALASHPGRGLDLDDHSDGWSGASATRDLPIEPAQPAELTLTVTSAGGTYHVDVIARDESGGPLAGPLVYEASGGALAEDKPLTNGHVRLSFSPAGSGHYVVSVTDPRTRVSSFVEVDVP